MKLYFTLFLLKASNCSTTLSEDAPLGEFCRLSVSDADQDGTPAFALDFSGFSISPSTSEFEILYAVSGGTAASLALASALDFETTKTYSFTITVSYIYVILRYFTSGF